MITTIITTLIERELTFFSFLFSIGYILVFLYARERMKEHSNKLQYEFALQYSRRQTFCAFTSTAGIMWMFLYGDYWDGGIPLLELWLQIFFNFVLLMGLILEFRSIVKLDESIGNEESTNEIGQANEPVPAVTPGEPVCKEPTEEEKQK